MNVVNTRIQQRYDTLQNWQQRNPVLLDGELAVVATDNQTRFKIGDGEHAFNDLNFIDQLKLTTVSAYANVLSSNMAAIGFENIVGTHSLAAGTNTSAATQHAVALGYKAATSSNGAFVFNGDQNYIASPYYDHGVGTFNVNAPLSDIYVQQSAFSDILSDKADKTALDAKIDINAAWPAWTSNGEYDWRQIVSHNGKLWKASEPFPSIEPGTGIGWVSVDINSILAANYQPKGNYLTAVPTTYKTYSQTIAALSSDGYATSTQVNQKSTVSFNQITTTGTNIGSITIDGTTTQIYAPNSGGGGGSGSTVEVSADYQSGTKIATISVDSVPTSIYIPNSSSGSTRYALATATLQTAGNSLSCAVDDQTITTIQVSSSSTPIIVQLPAQPADGARDFILRIEISSSTAPTFTFNGVNETIDFDSEDDDWAVMEPGLNLVSFTETKRGDGSGNGGGGSNVVYHTVTFDPGSYTSLANPSDATRQVADGEAVGTLPAVTSDSSVFRGWYTEQNGFGTQVTESTVITANVTFYAYMRQTSG